MTLRERVCDEVRQAVRDTMTGLYDETALVPLVADRVIAMLTEDRRALVEACQMARADLMAWAAHDALDDRDAVQARYANTPAILAIDAALKAGEGEK